MSRIPPEIADQIKLAADITEVVGGFVTLKRKGQNLWAPCPFHDEKTASFSVAPNKGFFKCFGCQKAGSVVDFVMEIEKISYPEALRWLAKRYGIPIPDTDAPASDEEKARQQERDSLFILTEWAKEFFKKQLAELQAFDEKLRHYADLRIKFDLDDGVKVNYGKFSDPQYGDILAEVKAICGTKDEE